MTLTLLHSKMFDVGDLPVLTFGDCVLKTGVIKRPLKLFVRFFNVFFFKIQKIKTFYIISELLHTFSRMLDVAYCYMCASWSVSVC